MLVTNTIIFAVTLGLGIPLLAGLGLWARWQRKRDLRAFGDEALVGRLTQHLSDTRRRLRFLMLIAGLLLGGLALAGPQYGTKMVEVKRQGVDVIMALDVSRSMLAEDVQPNRLKRAQQELATLIDALSGDRVGVVAFAGSSQIACPLTTDYSAAKMFLNYLTPDTVAQQGTNLAQAIRTALATYGEGSEGYRVLVLLTDGENHDAEAMAAAREAKAAGVRILAIGFGNPEGEPIPLRREDGSIAGYVKDSKGQTVVSKLDEATLKEITALTQGSYITAYHGGIEADKIAQMIDHMQKRDVSGGKFGAYEDRFQFVLLPALLLLLAAFWLPERKRAWLLLMLVMLMPARSGWAGLAEDNNAGNRKYQKGEYAEALEAYRDAQIKKPDAPVVAYNLGNALHRLERYEDAEKDFQRALAVKDPKLRAKTLYNLGNNYFAQQKYAEAVKHYKEALKLRPRDEDTLYNLSQAVQFMKNPPPQKQDQKSKDNQQGQGKDQQPQQKSGQDKSDPKAGGKKDQSAGQQEKDQQTEQDKKGEAKPEEGKDEQTPQQDVQDAPKPGEMPRQEAENLLNAVREAEKEAQKERMKKMQNQPESRGRQDW